jgi:hypothetical protein
MAILVQQVAAMSAHETINLSVDNTYKWRQHGEVHIEAVSFVLVHIVC